MNALRYYNLFGLILFIGGFTLLITSIGWLPSVGVFLVIWANNIMLQLNGKLKD